MKKGLNMGIALLIVVVVLGVVFGVMYSLSEAPISNKPAFSGPGKGK